jgi:hypothetical protein
LKLYLIAMRTNFRFLTAIAIIGTCGFAVAQGFGVAHFSVAMVNVDSPEKRAEIVNSWSSAPDLASRALQADLTERIDPADQNEANRQRQTLSALVSIKPMSSYAWLSLSGLQLITDQPMEQVFDSLELSMLTGPNEAYVMGERAVFALSLWDRLPADLKRHTAVDVGAMMFPRTPAEGEMLGKIRAVLASQSDWVRNELREAVVATGVSPEETQKALGF